jgi:hypothetical protein
VVAPSGGSPSRPVRLTRFESMRSDTVEIVIGDVVVRAGGDVEPDRLADVIRAVHAVELQGLNGLGLALTKYLIVLDAEISDWFA